MATDQAILDEARNSLLRILQADTAEWSEFDRQQRTLDIKELRLTIADYESKVASGGTRRIIQPVIRVNI